MNRAAVKTLAILETLVRNRDGLTLTQLAQALKMPISSTHELVATLVELGYLQREAELRRFKIGFKLLDLGQAYLHDMELYVAASSLLGQVSKSLDSVTSLYVFHPAEGAVLSIAEEGGAPHLRVLWQRKWWQSVLHCASPSKLFLSTLDDDEVESILSRVGMAQFTPNTITDLARLKSELGNVRTSGYAIEKEELVLGIGCIAVPIVVSGSAIGALSARVSADKLEDDFISRAVDVLKGACASIANTVSTEQPAGALSRNDPLSRPAIRKVIGGRAVKKQRSRMPA